MKKLNLFGFMALGFVLLAGMTACSAGMSDTENAQSNSNKGQTEIYTTAVSGVTVQYTIVNDWGNGFVADVDIKNNSGADLKGWKLTFSFPGNQVITGFWSAKVTQVGNNVTAVNETYNIDIPNGGTVKWGFQATYSGANAKPANFVLNGDSTTVSSATLSSKASSAKSSSSAPKSSSSSSKSSSKSSTASMTTIPTDVRLWCLSDRSIERANFGNYTAHYVETANTKQTFKVAAGDFDLRNDGVTKECRVEIYDINKYAPSTTWHSFKATFVINTTSVKEFSFFQLKNNTTENPQIMYHYENGKVTFAPRGLGPTVCATGMNNQPFTIEVRTDGYTEEVYFNGVKKFSGVPGQTGPTVKNYFRWGIYMNYPADQAFTVNVSGITRN